MGIFDGLGRIVRSQLLDVIEWTDTTQNTMVHRFGTDGKEIMMGAQLTVRESQVAVFVNEGRVADVFSPGRYQLSTANMPIMTALESWKFGFNSPFKAEVYFINTKQFVDQKWGSANPIMMRDQDFGIVRIRCFGTYAFRVADPTVFMKELFGTSAVYTVDDINEQLKGFLISGFSDALGEAKTPALDLAANYNELGDLSKTKLQNKFAGFGLELCSFTVENISLPEEVEKAMDQRASMGAVGNMSTFTKYQAAQAIRDAAQNPSGGAVGAGVGIGAGLGLGQMMAGAFNSSEQAESVPDSGTTTCTECGKTVAIGRFCPECGAALPKSKFCSSCGKPIKAGAKFCTECGAEQ